MVWYSERKSGDTVLTFFRFPFKELTSVLFLVYLSMCHKRWEDGTEKG